MKSEFIVVREVERSPGAKRKIVKEVTLTRGGHLHFLMNLGMTHSITMRRTDGSSVEYTRLDREVVIPDPKKKNKEEVAS